MAAEPEPARITDIDINGPARTLAILRWSDYVLVVMSGLGCVSLVPQLVAQLRGGEAAGFGVIAAMFAVFGFAAYTGWRHVGVIDPRVWRSYLLVFPLLTVLAVVMAAGSLSQVSTKGWGGLEDMGSTLSLISGLYYAGIAIPGFVCVLRLRRARIPPAGARLTTVLESLAAREGGAARVPRHVPPARLLRGVLVGIAGALVLVGYLLVPLPAEGERPSLVLRFGQQIQLFGFFLLVRARRYFQVSADSLLAADRRAPVLFLRSFADDERQQYGNSQRALLDFSLETRLANHFSRFGPFIAIGSPKESVPQPGAARIVLRDDQWQARVLGWMRDANLIIMYCGKTQSVNWELSHVLESGAVTRLILMFPEVKSWRSSRRKKDITERVQRLREIFKDTPWNEELMTFDNFQGARAMLFRADGSMVFVRSRSRSRDAYHLAALIAHQQLLEPAGVPAEVAAPPSWPRRHVAKALSAALLVAAALLVGLRQATPDFGHRLTFKKGELYYRGRVTEAEAKSVGQYLAELGFFSDDHATTVQLDRERDAYQLRFVVDKEYTKDPRAALQFGQLGLGVSQNALAGARTEVVLCDAHLKPVKTLPQTSRLTFRKGILQYTAPVDEQDARRVGDFLVNAEYFGDERDALVSLNRDEHGYQLRFVVDPSRASDPEILAAFSQLSAGISRLALRGQPVVALLCDDALEPVGRVPPLAR